MDLETPLKVFGFLGIWLNFNKYSASALGVELFRQICDSVRLDLMDNFTQL